MSLIRNLASICGEADAVRRNSSVELLRIMAMFLITAHHYLSYSNANVLSESFGLNKVLSETFLWSGGKIGVVLFFMISAWYLPADGSLRASFRRVWILEREVLFWSVILLICSTLLKPEHVSGSLILQSILPASTNLWWYVTAYAVFLLIFPFLAKGLKALGRKYHLALCCVCFILWSLAEGFLPFMSLGMPGGSFLSFVYLYTLVSFYRWYMPLMKSRTARIMITCGYGLLMLVAVIGGIVGTSTSGLNRIQVYLSSAEFKFCPIIIGFGVFSLFISQEFYNKIINRVATSMLAVYLITEYPVVREVLWHTVSIQPTVWHKWYALPTICGAVIAIMAGICVIDGIRQIVFHRTVDRHRGKLFDWLWEHICNSRIAKKIQTIGQ